MGSVLRTRNDGFGGSRSPLQVGAELFGHAGIESDTEILELVLDTLSLLEIPDVHIDLGHVGIFRSLAAQAELSPGEEEILFDTLQRKAVTELSDSVSALSISDEQKQQFIALVDLNGDISVIDKARQILTGDDVKKELDNLQAIAQGILARAPAQKLYFDLSELRGYNYHTGVVFAAYLPGLGQEITQGGRYDGIGETFGRSRPATGFSADLTYLVSLRKTAVQSNTEESIFAPAVRDPELLMMVASLRQQGKKVISELTHSNSDGQAMGCTHALSNESGKWQLVEVAS